MSRGLLHLRAFRVFEWYQSSRPQWGGAYDILGHQANLDVFGTNRSSHPGGSRAGTLHLRRNNPTRILAAHTRKRPISGLEPRVDASTSSGTRAFRRSVSTDRLSPAPVTTSTYWRYNFFRDPHGHNYHLHVKTAFSLLDTLAAWGARQAKGPRKIAVLKSRASEDWWYMKIFLASRVIRRIVREASSPNWRPWRCCWRTAIRSRCSTSISLRTMPT